MSTTAQESALERQVREEQEAHDKIVRGEIEVCADCGEPFTANICQTEGCGLSGQHITADNPTQPDPEGTKLFDAAAFETEALALPKVDGEGVSKIALRFGGRVWLDRSSASDVAMVRDLKMGQTVTLLVEATVGPPIPGYTTDKEGDLDVLSLSRRLAVTGVYKPVPEKLSELAGEQPEAA
jgi:hypothetical protein